MSEEKAIEFDEKVAILEQERLAKAARRKRNKKLRIVILVIAVLLTAALVWYLFFGRKMIAEKQAAKTVEIVAGENQSIRYAKIDEINGNEMTVTYLMEMSFDKDTDEAADDGEAGESKRPDMGDFKGGFPGEMPEGFEGFSGEMPDMPEGFSGEMPEGFYGGFQGGRDFGNGDLQGGFPGGEDFSGGFPDGGDFPGRTGKSDDAKYGGASDMISLNRKNYIMGRDSETRYIPVGTVVTTKLGTETTFSRLQAGDYIAIVTEEDEMVAIYIVG